MKSSLIKQFNYKIFAIIAVVFFTSCSSKDRKLIEMSSDEIVQEFDLNQEKLKKFTVAEDSSTVEKDSVNVTKQESTSIKKVIKKKKVTVKKKKVVKKEKPKKIEVKAKAVIEKKKPTLPEGYPKKYIGYNKDSQKYWDIFDPTFFSGENMSFKVAYMGVTAGYIDLMTKPEVSIGGVESYHFEAYLRSADYYSYIYSLDDRLDSFVRKDNFTPIKLTLIQRESSQRVDDLQFFDHDELKTMSFYKKEKKGKVTKKQKEAFIPKYFNDSFSSIYFVRGLPLELNDEYSFPIVTRGKVWIMKLKVISVSDKVSVNEGFYSNAIKIKAETHFPGVLKKKGDIVFWYSNDKVRKLLKFEAKVKIGTIRGQLEKYTPGRNN